MFSIGPPRNYTVMIEWGQKLKLKQILRASNKTPKIPGPKTSPPLPQELRTSSVLTVTYCTEKQLQIQ